MRHPHVGSCHEDREKFCEAEASHGIMGLMSALSCLAEHHQKDLLSDKCSGTVTVATLPCLPDLKSHCSSSSTLHHCFQESHHKFSEACNSTLAKAASHPVVKTEPSVPVPITIKKAERAVVEVFDAPRVTKVAKSAKMTSPVKSSLFQSLSWDSNGMMRPMLNHKRYIKTGLIVLGALFVAVASIYFARRSRGTRKKAKRTAIQFGKMQVVMTGGHPDDDQL